MQKTHSSGPARACDPTLDMAITGLMAALVFTGTYFFKIPTAFGYTHLGDCMIILTVCLFGTRRGMLAGAIGAGLSDFIAGYAAWVLPTIVLKGGWALIMGLIMYRLLPHFKYSWLAGAVTGGIFHVIGYTLVKIPLYGGGVAMAECFTLVAQTAAGIVLGGVAYTVLSRSPAIRSLRVKLLFSSFFIIFIPNGNIFTKILILYHSITDPYIVKLCHSFKKFY